MQLKGGDSCEYLGTPPPPPAPRMSLRYRILTKNNFGTKINEIDLKLHSNLYSVNFNLILGTTFSTPISTNEAVPLVNYSS